MYDLVPIIELLEQEIASRIDRRRKTYRKRRGWHAFRRALARLLLSLSCRIAPPYETESA